MAASYVYALGGIEPRFPRLSVEKEFAQATGRAETANLTDRQALRQVLEQNRYLVKQLCWVMTVGGLETYLVVPGDPTDTNLLIETLRPNPRPGDVDLVVAMRGPLAPPGNVQWPDRSDHCIRPALFVRSGFADRVDTATGASSSREV